MTRAELRAWARRELGDTVAPYVWSDERLNDALATAVAEIGQRWPRRVVVTGATTVGARLLSVPAETRRVTLVECPPGDFLPEEELTPAYTGVGDAPDWGWARAWRYDRTTQAVTLNWAPGESGTAYRLHTVAGRVCPANDVDAVPLDLGDEPLCVALACQIAWDGRRLEDAKRGLSGSGSNPFATRLAAMFARRRRPRVIGAGR